MMQHNNRNIEQGAYYAIKCSKPRMIIDNSAHIFIEA